MKRLVHYTGLEIAVIGLSGRFPKANNVQAFWSNLAEGRNCISQFSEEELLSAGESESTIKNPDYIRAGSCLQDKDCFDAAFFGYRPDEAELMDPQIRIFHEVCWEALEDSGYASATANHKIGLFASGSTRLNWSIYAAIKNSQEQLVDHLTMQQLSDVASLSSMISYRLNLVGPVVFLQTACSSSLAAIHQACNSLLLGECKLALAGGVTINNFSDQGYVFQKGQIQSADGKCCPFDHKASGTVFGEGAGAVVLKRLKDAIKDGDNIHAVIKGSAINNDGNNKVGYTAPSVSGQAEVISKALKNAKIEPDTVSYIEAHGTGTALGDPVEIEALTLAFRASGSTMSNYCVLGSLKSNIGHLDAASGVAGLIKVVMALKHKQLPGTVHYEKPNPNINFETTPFYVTNHLTAWHSKSFPLRAGVSSLGVGGTNVHIILEEAPSKEQSDPGRHCHAITLSAKTPDALVRNAKNFQFYLENQKNTELSDIAYTSNVYGPSFEYKKSIVCSNHEEAIQQLASINTMAVVASIEKKNKLAFMFPGQGVQHHKMCLELMNTESVFREEVQKCLEIIKLQSGKDVNDALFGDNAEKINDTEFTQPALFVIEYAMARLLMHWGVQPDVMIGHSVGEYVAACLSGVFTLQDSLRLVAKRGELMQPMVKGSMLSIVISQPRLRSYLIKHPEVSLAAVNSDSACVVAGHDVAISRLKEEIEMAGFVTKKINTSHAFHSHMMDEMLADFEQEVRCVKMHPIQIPFISNLTGKHALNKEITDPKYWVNQLRNTVRFADGISTIMAAPNVLFVEVGPGKALSSFVGANDLRDETHQIVSLLGRSKDGVDNSFELLGAIGKLWQHGIYIDWKAYYARERRQKVSLPTYSFEKIKYTVDVDPKAMIMEMTTDKASVRNNLQEWFYAPTWRLSKNLSNRNKELAGGCTLIFADSCGISDSMADHFKSKQAQIVTVKQGVKFQQKKFDDYVLDPAGQDGYQQLFRELDKNSLLPDRIVHCWAITDEVERWAVENVEANIDLYFYSIVNTIKAIQKHKSGLRELTVLSNSLHPVFESDHKIPVTKSLTTGLLKVIGQEYPGIATAHIDITLSEARDEYYLTKLFAEIVNPEHGKIVSYRNSCRWVQTFDKIRIDQTLAVTSLKHDGIYLITGGLGGFGFIISKYLVKHYNAKLILVGREKLPSRAEWEEMASGQFDESVKTKVERVRSIEREGGEVLYLHSDISNKEQFSEAVSLSEKHFGPINGVFHAAGITQGNSINAMHKLHKADYECQFTSKMLGLATIHSVFKDKQLDFCLLTSSLASLLGGLGFGAYAAASAFMDYFVQSQKIQHSLKNWVSVNFDGINFDEAEDDYIKYQELPDLIHAILRLKELPQVVVSTKDLQPRIDDWVSKRKVSSDAKEEETNNEVVTNVGNSTTPDIEKTLLKLWTNFFGRCNFGIDHDFFEIGGDSLKALTLNARINKTFRINLPLSVLFEKPTIKILAAHITVLRNSGVEQEVHAHIERASAKPYYALSPSQRNLYLLHKLDKNGMAYNLPQVLKLEGKLDANKLRTVFKKLIDRHESLRTSFHEIDGYAVQKIEHDVSFEIIQDAFPKDSVDEWLKAFIVPFDLSVAPLLSVGLVKLADNEHLLIVDMHHIITDGISQSVLIKDFMALYNNEELSELPLQYKDYAEWLEHEEQHERMAQRRSFWLQEFSEKPMVLDLPTDYPRPLAKTYSGNNISFFLTKEITEKLRAVGEETGATMFMTVLTVFNVFLARLSNQEDICVGTGVAGRYHPDVENIMGMFVNTLVLRNYPKGQVTFREFLGTVKARVIACFDHQSYQYAALVDALNIPRDTSRNPLFDVMLAFQNFEQGELIIPGLTLKPYDIPRRVAKFDLELTVVELPEGLHLNFEYSTDLFTEQTIGRFISYFGSIVSEITADPNKKLSQINILSEEERHQLLYDFNNTSFSYPSEKTIVDLFEDQVNQH
ncbi:MAG: SDR family NAD(P)-dependent oxidoreductase, partial [Cytophagales bacterium]|nr:SDR family NAD(P)-dependent oxidoreductase [Cytophagales bacterium]MCA6369028.1 SDR family NAD(P)-dependent oxidoreductase [Cytophagales bacterium]MCA6373354.1 SDR family NAD(P)-dependent oxidoreductase [Cytophagales bacterium]MCA6378024.1 SDR family NAD(P)-dependent oxidoreductase [Cytophagales bacterium]MCA6382508.1 SDR family NAD(P)-dependent oxidoreductase [Cytophagales bacterium]